MLRHDHSTARLAGRRWVGSAPLRSRAVVYAGPRAGGRHADAGGQSADGASVVSRLARRRPGGVEGGGSAGSQTAARSTAARSGRARVAPRSPASRLRQGSLDAAARGGRHRAVDGGALSSRSRLVHLAGPELVRAAPRSPGERAGRARDSAVGQHALAHGGNSRCQCATFSHRFSDTMRHLLRRPGPFSVSVLR